MAAREILESGDWIHLTVNGRPYEKKPPLLMWMQAGLGSLTGEISEWEARLPSALAGVGVVGLTALLGLLLFGRAAGFWGALFLAVTPFFVREGRLARMDMLVALTTTASFTGFALYERRIGPRWAALLLFLLPLPAGVLAKWAGPLFVLPPVILYLLLLCRRRHFPLWPVLAGIVLSLVPFLVYSDLSEFGRIAMGKAHSRPFYYQLLRFPAVTAPFVLLLPYALLRARRGNLSAGEKRGLRLSAIWVAFGLLLLTLNGSKRSNYLEPLLPPAMLIAGWTASLAVEAGRLPGLGRLSPRRTFETVAGLLAIGCLAFTLYLMPRQNDEESVRPFVDVIRARAAPDAEVGYAGRAKPGGRWPGPELVFYLEERIAPLARDVEVLAWLRSDGERFVICRPDRYESLMRRGGGKLPTGIRLEARQTFAKDPYVLVSNRRGEGETVVIGPEERGAGSASE